MQFTLIGAGIMSVTLGVMLKKVWPDAKIHIYERLSSVGAESSHAWNNAGTGHSSFCELNYTPELEDGTIDMTKALKIAESFEISKQFWSFLKENNFIPKDVAFINDIDHMSLVWGKENCEYLKKRYDTFIQYGIFEDMQFSDDHDVLKTWFPLMMKGRDPKQQVAATRMPIGTDVNFGAITSGMIKYLSSCDGVELFLGKEIQEIDKQEDGTWTIEVEDVETGEETNVVSDFVFIGAGGGAIPLLEKTGIPESKGYGGFPVSGQWLKCTNPEVIEQHEAKVYGKADHGSPPMSVPHLDTRIINGEKALLFGPYAGFSTKFLKNGSFMDLPLSVEAHNVWPLLSAGWHNMALTKYLIKQVMQSPEDRFAMLQKYFPEAKFEDWDLEMAGQRVQIIKEDFEKGGKLQFGTEIVSSADGSLAALLGASPGASTSVSIMIDVLAKCFPYQMEKESWQDKIREMIPTYGRSLIKDSELCKATRKRTTGILKLEAYKAT